MAETKYTYAISQLSNGIASAKITQEILAAMLGQSLVRINTGGDDLDIYFAEPLSVPDKASLDALVAAHAGPVQYVKTHNTKTLTADSNIMGTDAQAWESIGSFTMDPGFFVSDAAAAFCKLVCQVKTTGLGAQFRVIEDLDGDVLVMNNPIVPMPDTAGLWVAFECVTNVPPRFGGATYTLQGRRGSSTLAAIKTAVLYLLETKTVE